MSSGELDQLVVQIGDRILSRLGLLENGTAARFPTSSASVTPSLTRFDTSIARLIDHTLLRPEAVSSDIVQLCCEARRYQFASVCVNPCWVALAVAELAGSGVKVGTVAGFPLGAATSEVKGESR
jgi:deoxyribose-phosphate aldolase